MPTSEDQLNGTEFINEFCRALWERGIQLIHANALRTKGRVERLFRTFRIGRLTR